MRSRPSSSSRSNSTEERGLNLVSGVHGRFFRARSMASECSESESARLFDNFSGRRSKSPGAPEEMSLLRSSERLKRVGFYKHSTPTELLARVPVQPGRTELFELFENSR